MSTLSQIDVVRAATNDPLLSDRKVRLGEREFTVVDLEYDAYLEFMAYMKPLLECALSAIPGVAGAGVSELLTPASLVSYCSKELPQMARLVCAQTDPDITVADVKRLGKTPFALAMVVLAQIEQNDMIRVVKDFFVQTAPLLKSLISARLTTKVTRS